jgi:hypothetical protein
MGDELHVFYFLIVRRHHASLRREKTVPVVLNVQVVPKLSITVDSIRAPCCVKNYSQTSY